MILSIKMCKKVVVFPIFFITAFLSGCMESEKVDEARIEERCKGNICSLALIDSSVVRSRNVIGKISDQYLTNDILEPLQGNNIQWTIEGDYKLPTNQQMANLGLPECIVECNLDDSNPTGVIFNKFGPQTVHVSGTVFDVNKNQRNIDITHHFITSVAEELPLIVATHDAMDYNFTIDFNGLGLLEDNPSHQWTIKQGDKVIYSSQEQDMNFSFDIVGGGDYTVNYELINENDPSNSLSTTLDINVVDDKDNNNLQLLANSITATATGNLVTASVNESEFNKAILALSDIYKKANFNWTIKSESESAIIAAPISKNGAVEVSFEQLSYDTNYTVGLVITSGGISTTRVEATTTTAAQPTVSISSDLYTVTESGKITITANASGNRSISAYNWPAEADLTNGWAYDGAASSTSPTAILIAPAYNDDSAVTSLTNFSMTVTDMQGIEIESAILKDVTVISSEPPTVLITGADVAYTGTDITLSADVTDLGGRKILSYSWYSGNVEVPSSAAGSHLNMIAPTDESSFNVVVEVETDDGMRRKSEPKIIQLYKRSVTLMAPDSEKEYVSRVANYLNRVSGPHDGNADFTTTSSSLKVTCNDGFGWPQNIKVPLWKESQTVPYRGSSKFELSTQGSTGLSTGLSNIMAWAAREDAGNGIRKRVVVLGCWPMKR